MYEFTKGGLAMSKHQQTENDWSLSQDEREHKMKQFLQGEIPVTMLPKEDDECDGGLRDAILALAHWNNKAKRHH
jgi:hypothetical protein